MNSSRFQNTYRILFWILPIIILYFIFQKIDFDAFRSNISKANPWLVMFGIGVYPLVIMIGASRWHLLLTQYNKKRLKPWFVLKHYWTGLALGFFAPASLGWDTYRIIVIGRYYGRYTLNTVTILVEKFLALITCMSMIIILYPLVPITTDPEIKQFVFPAYILFSIAVFLLLIINILARNRLMSRLLEKLEVSFVNMLSKIGQSVGLNVREQMSDISFKAMITPLIALRQLLPLLILSFGIQFVSAAGNQLFFRALGYTVPFIVNLFILPILFFIFLLPISFGSLGIREGAYIILYGLFGVPAEIALLVSFFSLTGLIVNNLIGGVLMFFSNFKPIKSGFLNKLARTREI